MITRKEAKSQGLKTYFTGKPCKHGHIALRSVSCGGCRECMRLRSYARFSANRAEYAERGKQWLKENPEWNRERARLWRKNNPRKHAANNAKRKASKLQRTPPWADLHEIKSFYEKCPEGHHVDHHYPLQGEKCSGLHVIENLRYLPASVNYAKGNKMPEDFFKSESDPNPSQT